MKLSRRQISGSFLYPGGGQFPELNTASATTNPKQVPLLFPGVGISLVPAATLYLLHHQRFYPLKIIWSCHASATFIYGGTKCCRLFIGPKANTRVLPQSRGWDFFFFKGLKAQNSPQKAANPITGVSKNDQVFTCNTLTKHRSPH